MGDLSEQFAVLQISSLFYVYANLKIGTESEGYPVATMGYVEMHFPIGQIGLACLAGVELKPGRCLICQTCKDLSLQAVR
ncbi:hypothetical protein UNDKW_5906 (plasmid) [Undibacterium sp. KW1]|nr:hypothetical protein UNDKW_5906 [Undibacterium sp. KW1]